MRTHTRTEQDAKQPIESVNLIDACMFFVVGQSPQVAGDLPFDIEEPITRIDVEEEGAVFRVTVYFDYKGEVFGKVIQYSGAIVILREIIQVS